MSYTNVAGAILTQLHDLFVGEFGGRVPVIWAEAADVSRAPEWIEVRLVSSEEAEPLLAFAEVRRYTFELLYLRRTRPGEDDIRGQRQRIEVAARLQRLLVDNAYTLDGTDYIWHGGSVGGIEYGVRLTEREDDQLIAVRMAWSCVVNEIIS